MARSSSRRGGGQSLVAGLLATVLLLLLLPLHAFLHAPAPGKRIQSSNRPLAGRRRASGVVLLLAGGLEGGPARGEEAAEGKCQDGGGSGGGGSSSSSSDGSRDRHQQRGVTSRGGLVRGMAAVSLAALAGQALALSPQAARAAEGSVRDEDLPAVAFKTKSGLRYYDVRKGEGPSPKWGQVAIIQYEGYVRASPFSRLVLFDDTYSRRTPYLVKHGNGRVIRGLDEGLHTMRLGGLRRIVVPLELGYTKTGLGPIPPNALRRKVLVRELTKAEQQEGEIVYDVELVSVYDDEADLGYYDDLTFDPEYLQVRAFIFYLLGCGLCAGLSWG
jgi:hypothetical protein